jgi:cytoskeletal protein RodZ
MMTGLIQALIEFASFPWEGAMSRNSKRNLISFILLSTLVLLACNLTKRLSGTPTPDLRTPDALTAEAEQAESAKKTADAKNTQDAAATAEFQANLDGTVTAAASTIEAANATVTSAAMTMEAVQEAAAATQTALAVPTGTPTDTPPPTATKTNTLPPAPLHTNTPSGASAPPASGMIVRGPGEKSPGDHGVQVKNKTGANVTIYMYGDPYDYTFYIPDGNHKIYLRPGSYSFTIFACGGQSTGSGVFNSNWVWTFQCK